MEAAMRTAIVGAGPTGLFAAVALARRGHDVTIVDRDSGPADDVTWERRAVMQFHHPHAFRRQVVDAVMAEIPEMWDALLAAGCTPAARPDQPEVLFGVRSRRMTFERVLRAAAVAEPRVDLRVGHVDSVAVESGRATGLIVDGSRADFDLVIDASGRNGRLGRDFRAPGEGGDCGIAYVSRQYELLPGADEGPYNLPVGIFAGYDRYIALVFMHDSRTFSVLVVRGRDDDALAQLRRNAAFERAATAIPAIATWTHPERARPITDVLPGGRLFNTYQAQVDERGRIAVDGLLFVGDAVCTTNPTAGRGVSTSLLQARELLRLLDADSRDLSSTALAFDAWCAEYIRPWYEDHVYWDADVVRRWAGGGIDTTRRLPTDLILARSDVDKSLMPVIGPFLSMDALPSSLDPIEPAVRAEYAAGWRPTTAPGPTRDELAEIISAA
jgi:2-polyprenyl-6-methoxyphenol hydroxylase-like FAD-dependent oxidoreductase